MLPGYPPKASGEEERYLRKLGHSPEVITLISGGLRNEKYKFNDFLDEISIRSLSNEFKIINWFDFTLPFLTFFSGYHIAGATFAPLIMKRKEYDVIVSHGSLTSMTGYSLWKTKRIPYVSLHWDPLSYILQKVYNKKFSKPVISGLSKIVTKMDRMLVENSLVTATGSKEHSKFLEELTGQKVETLFPGCFPLKQIPKKRGSYLLAIDRWDPGNNPQMLLDVLSRLDCKPELIVAGFWWSIELQEKFIEKCKKMGLTKQVKVVGPVSEKKLNELYSNARALLHPIEETSISMPAMEAACHGCPLIMPKGTPLFNNGINGFFPPENDLDEYSKYVERFVHDERLAWKMGQEGWKVVLENTWEHHAGKLEKMILNNL